jgi:hypothetical protein
MSLAEIYIDVDISLKQDIHLKEISDTLNKILESVPDIESKRRDPRIVELVCQYIENYAKDKKYNLDKKQIAVNFLKKRFGLQPEELRDLDVQIDRDMRHGIIRKVPTSTIVKKAVLRFLKKKVVG